jgi:hypothetical protein
MLLVTLAVMGLMVLVATVSPPDPGRNLGTRQPSPAPVTAAPQVSDPDAFDVSETVSAAPDAKEKTIEATLGDRIEILVEGSAPDGVALGDLRIEELDEGVPARFELLAETPGDYPLVLVNEDRRIGTLEIR